MWVWPTFLPSSSFSLSWSLSSPLEDRTSECHSARHLTFSLQTWKSNANLAVTWLKRKEAANSHGRAAALRVHCETGNAAPSPSSEDRGSSDGLLDRHWGPYCCWKYPQILQQWKQWPLCSGTFSRGFLTRTSCFVEIIQIPTELMVTSAWFYA